MISRFAASRSALDPAWSSRSEIAWNWLRSVAISESVMSSGPRSSQGEPFLRAEKLACVEHNNRAVRLAEDTGDVLGGQASHHGRRWGDGPGVNPDDLTDRIDDDADPLIFQLQHHDPGLLLLRRRHVEAFAEIHHRDYAVAIGQHALQKRRCVG